jgi:hypothetical protein
MTEALLPEVIRKILEELKFLGMVKKNIKPCFKTRTFAEADTLVGKAYRTWLWTESHSDMIERVKYAVENGVRYYSTANLLVHQEMILESLIQAKTGINNLIVTYKDTPEVLVSLEVTLASLNTFLKGIKPEEFRDEVVFEEPVLN